MKTTLNEKVKNLKIKKPSRPVWAVFKILANILYYKKCKVEIQSSVDMSKYKGKPLIVVSNHASRMDYAFVVFAVKGRRINYIAAENEFHRDHLQLVFKLAHVIPKKNFYPDMTTIRGCTKILKKSKEGTIALFPCGMSTASGAQQPSMLGTGKLIKHFGAHVLGLRIHGGYFVSPKFDVKERYGKVIVEVFELFNPEQLKTLDEHQVQQMVDEAIYTDDYAWNKDLQHSYKCRGDVAHNLHQLLYKCPACGTEMQMEASGNTIVCKHCGNGATLDNKYNLVPLLGSRIPANIKEWCDNQRRDIRRKILADPNFAIEEHVQLGLMRDYKYMTKKKVADIVGDGTLRMDKTGLTYTGTRNGQPWTVHIRSENINTICLPVDASFFYTYAAEGEFLQFVPDQFSCMRWTNVVEEFHRVNGGKWQNYPWFDYENDSPLIEG